MAKDVRRALMIAHEVGSPERQQAFDQWGGAPERWYHGTSKDVDFSKFKIGRHGAWFARDPKSASMYAENNDSQGYKRDGWNVVKTNTRSRVIPVHLKLGKSHTGPLPDSFKTENYKKAQSEWFDQLRAQGYDSWVPEGGDVAVVLKDPTQIKSAIGNRGTYDPNEADIGKAAGGSATKRALMIARDQRALLRRIANIYPGPGGGMDPTPGGGGYSGPGGGKYIGPSHYAEGGSVPPFKLHSGAAKIIKSKGQAKATPQQYAAMPGIKPDELKHSKFDTLGSKALPREEVIKHLEDNALPLQETQLGGEGRNTATKFHDPKTTLPGGKNYREVLLHTPGGEEHKRARLNALGDQGDALLKGRSVAQLTPEERAKWADLEQQHNAIADADDEYKSGHWETPNVLAHVRMSDRVGPNGEKILHLEEAQSDWGQQGRERGFGSEQIVQQPSGTWSVVAPNGDASHGYATRELAERNMSPAGLPRGPYVDNTQKWTDLALKRVLHEAAHGGYDKIVVTPGDEQNKRYDLSRQVKNIQYYPDLGYLHATTHDDRGVEHEDVKPEDLSKHIGKEAADRILKQGMQRYEGRGKLGGEFYHELEGDGLKMGGAGMRGYYDNILPKRLQALAQQHDPQAKVNLHAHDLSGAPDPAEVKNRAISMAHNTGDIDDPTEAAWNAADPEVRDWHTEHATAEQARTDFAEGINHASAPLHSLDVTPQMRDSIKANGFNSFKRGGEVEDPIKDWQWRPTEDVRNELQLDEIPSHVHKFGEFMDETARRAATQGLTPRDLIKAYAITRSSIGRGALPVSTVRRPKNPEYGFDALPKGLQGTLRPEGAMGHWLHTKMGQRYLDEAEAGRVDEEAVRDAIKSMGAFGLPDTAEGKALRWAPKNLPGQEGRVSELIARAHRGQSSPEEWRGEMRVPGIAESKAGFFASMLGRGDQPTLDARQIILNTGQSTKKAAPYLSPKGAKEAAVNRLADRQTELGLKHDKSMSPFYQHLTHHTIWDKTGGGETTHDDLMQALRGAKDGGRQGYKKGGAVDHPVAAALRQTLPPEAFTDATPSQVRAALEKTVSPFSGDPEHVKEALRIASTFKVPTTTTSPGGYYNISQDRSPEEVAVKLAGLPGVTPKPVRKMSWEDLHKKGGSFVNLGGDRSTFGRLTRINGEPLAWPVDLHAGPNYMRELNPGLVWANAPGHATSLTNTIRRAADKGPVYGVYAPMGPRAVDSAHHMFDAVMAQIPGRDISKEDAAAFDAEIKQGMHMPIKKRPSASKALEKWPGILNAKEASEFARTLPGEQRSGILQHMDKKSWKDKGFPQIGVTRVAITDPDVFKASGNMLGHRVVQLDPSKMVEETKFKHGTYSAPTAGEYVGDVPLVQRHYAAPDVIEQRLMKPTVAGDIIHPYSASPVGRSSARKIFEEQKNIQPLNQRQLDSTMQGLERQKQYGLKTGGRVGYTPGGGVEQLQQNLHQSFSDLNRQVAAQGPQQQQQAMPQAPYGAYQRMERQATGQAPNDAYQRMMAQALNGKTYEEMFPTTPKVAAPAPAVAPVQFAADAMPYYQTNYGPSPTEILGGDGDGSDGGSGGDGNLKRGGRATNIVERALAVTRRK
jgi:hypothetical protein